MGLSLAFGSRSNASPSIYCSFRSAQLMRKGRVLRCWRPACNRFLLHRRESGSGISRGQPQKARADCNHARVCGRLPVPRINPDAQPTQNRHEFEHFRLPRTQWVSPIPDILRSSRPPELPLVCLHIHLPPAEPNALGFQAQPLLEGRIAAQLDFAACAQHTLPGQSEPTIQNPCHQPCGTGKSRGSRNRPVSRNLALWNRADRSLDPHTDFCRTIFTRFCRSTRSGGEILSNDLLFSVTEPALSEAEGSLRGEMFLLTVRSIPRESATTIPPKPATTKRSPAASDEVLPVSPSPRKFRCRSKIESRSAQSSPPSP